MANNPSKKAALIVSVLGISACVLYNLMLISPYNNYFLTSTIKLLLFVSFAIFGMSYVPNLKFKDVFGLGGNLKTLKNPMFLSVACMLIVIVAFFLAGSFVDDGQILKGLSGEGITKATYPFVFLNIVFVNAFLEEFFFRGFLFFTLFRMGYKKYAYIFSSIAFAIYHWVMISTWFSHLIFALCMIALFVAGVIFNEIDRRSNNIYGGFLVHLGANLGINLIGAYLFITQ